MLGLDRHVQAQTEVAGRIELLDPDHVEDGVARGEVVAVGARERLGVALEERPRALLAELLEEGLAEVVAPGAGCSREARLDLGDVDIGVASGRREDHVVQARQHRLGDPRREVDVRAGEGLLQDLVDPPAVRRVEALARQVDEA